MANLEDLNLILQLTESIELAVKKLESSLQKQDIEGFKKAKEGILKFQKQISEILG